MTYFTNKKKGNPVLKQRKREDDLIRAAMEVNMNLSLLALHQKFGFGQKRAINDFVGQYGDLVDSYQRGYISLDDIRAMNREFGAEVVFDGNRVVVRSCEKEEL